MVVPRKSVLIPIIHLVLVLFFTVRVFVPRRDRNVSPQTVGACSDWRGPIDWSRYSVNGMGSNAALGKITIRWVRWERKRICGTHLFFYFCRVSNYFLLGVSSFFFLSFIFACTAFFSLFCFVFLFLSLVLVVVGGTVPFERDERHITRAMRREFDSRKKKKRVKRRRRRIDQGRHAVCLKTTRRIQSMALRLVRNWGRLNV